MCFGLSDPPSSVEDFQPSRARNAQKTAEMRAKNTVPRFVVDGQGGIKRDHGYSSICDSLGCDVRAGEHGHPRFVELRSVGD